jgi:hypothetical protein
MTTETINQQPTLTQMIMEDAKEDLSKNEKVEEEEEEEDILNIDIYKIPFNPKIPKSLENGIISESSKKETISIQEDPKSDRSDNESENFKEKSDQSTINPTKLQVASKTVPKKRSPKKSLPSSSPSPSSPKKNQKRKIEEVVKSQKNEKIIYISKGFATTKKNKEAERLINSTDYLTQTDNILECTEYLILDHTTTEKVKDSHIICLFRNIEIITLDTLKDYSNGVFKMREIESFPIGEKLNAFENAIPQTKSNFKKMELIITSKNPNPNLISIISFLKEGITLFDLDNDYKLLGIKHPICKFYMENDHDDLCSCSEELNNCSVCKLRKLNPTIYFTFGNHLFYTREVVHVQEIIDEFERMHIDFLHIGEKNDLSKFEVNYATFMKSLIDLKHPKDFFIEKDYSMKRVLETYLKEGKISFDGLTYKIKI